MEDSVFFGSLARWIVYWKRLVPPSLVPSININSNPPGKKRWILSWASKHCKCAVHKISTYMYIIIYIWCTIYIITLDVPPSCSSGQINLYMLGSKKLSTPKPTWHRGKQWHPQFGNLEILQIAAQSHHHKTWQCQKSTIPRNGATIQWLVLTFAAKPRPQKRLLKIISFNF